MRPNPQFSVDLVTFTDEILNGKLHFLCSDYKSTNIDPRGTPQFTVFGRSFENTLSNETKVVCAKED